MVSSEGGIGKTLVGLFGPVDVPFCDPSVEVVVLLVRRGFLGGGGPGLLDFLDGVLR